MHIETAFMSTYYVCRSGIVDRAGSYFTITLEHYITRSLIALKKPRKTILQGTLIIFRISAPEKHKRIN